MQVHIQNDGPVTIELESPIVNNKSINKTETAGQTKSSNDIVPNSVLLNEARTT